MIEYLWYFGLFGGVTYLVLYVNLMLRKRIYKKKINCSGKTVLITGGSAGIGLYTAKYFAENDAYVIIAARNAENGENAVKNLQTVTGNKNIRFKQLDISLMTSVRDFTESFLKEEKHLHILVNNAGISRASTSRTTEGLDSIMATNHFGPFLLTNLLLPLLKQTPASRIVNLSSTSHMVGKIDFNASNFIKSPHLKPTWTPYADSKMANILFTIELSRRLENSDVTTYSVMPGFVRTKAAYDYGFSWLPFTKILILMGFSKTPEEGAQTSIYCSVEPGIEKDSGKYFEECGLSKLIRPAARDKTLAKQLWEFSEKITEL